LIRKTSVSGLLTIGANSAKWRNRLANKSRMHLLRSLLAFRRQKLWRMNRRPHLISKSQGQGSGIRERATETMETALCRYPATIQATLDNADAIGEGSRGITSERVRRLSADVQPECLAEVETRPPLKAVYLSIICRNRL
jgi:hypothetical protein